MAMGKKKRRQQEDLWVATSEVPRTAGHPFYERLNGLFNEHGFDDFVEGLCAKFYADKMGRPSLAPGVYFRLLLVGYFERDRIGTRNCLESQRFSGTARVSGIETERVAV